MLCECLRHKTHILMFVVVDAFLRSVKICFISALLQFFLETSLEVFNNDDNIFSGRTFLDIAQGLAIGQSVVSCLVKTIRRKADPL